MVVNISATAVCTESSMIWNPMIAEYSTYVKTNTYCYFACKNADKANAYNRTLNAIIIAI